MLRDVRCLDYATTAEAAFLSAGGAWAGWSAQVKILLCYNIIIIIVFYIIGQNTSQYFPLSLPDRQQRRLHSLRGS